MSVLLALALSASAAPASERPTHLDLRSQAEESHAGRTLVRYAQHHEGERVLGAGVAALVDEAGRSTVVHSNTREDLRPGARVVPAARARELALAACDLPLGRTLEPGVTWYLGITHMACESQTLAFTPTWTLLEPEVEEPGGCSHTGGLPLWLGLAGLLGLLARLASTLARCESAR